MKKLNNLFTLLSALLLLGACEKDGDTYFLSSPEENELIASANSVVLTKETAKFYALSLAWTDPDAASERFKIPAYHRCTNFRTGFTHGRFLRADSGNDRKWSIKDVLCLRFKYRRLSVESYSRRRSTALFPACRKKRK